MLTQRNAKFMGLRDRGVLREGLRADINIIDMDRLQLHRPRIEADLPAGGKRLLQDATGYLATICAGSVVTESGRLTAARPGRLVRAG